MRKLITSIEVIDNALLNGNLDPSLIKDSFIEVSQEEHIRPVLTQDLYDLLVSENDAQVFTGLNETLLTNYIKPALSFFVISDVIPAITLRVTNKGVMLGNSETSQQSGREERAEMVKKYKELGQTMIDKMQRYIDNNTSYFPLYENGSSTKVSTKIIGGIIL